MPRLRVCPLSLAVFFGTAALVALQLRKQKRAKNSSSGDDQQTKSAAPDSATGKTADDDGAELPTCQVVFVLGAPGVGKGTQCELLTQRLTRQKWVHLSAGDLLRAERTKDNSALGDEINACISAGQLVKSEITCKLLENAMREHYFQNNNGGGVTHFLIDGFPRSQGNVDAWEETMKQHSVQCILDFVCPEEVLIGRLLERGKSSGRNDDNLETVKKRFDTFQKETQPILEHYRKKNTIPVCTIPADKPVEDVYQDTVLYFA